MTPDAFWGIPLRGAGQPANDVGPSSQVPDFPPLSIQLPSAPSSYDVICAPSRAPALDSGCVDELSYDQLHDLCTPRGFCPEVSKAVLSTGLASIQDQDLSHATAVDEKMDTSATGAGKRDRLPAYVVEQLQGPTCVPDRRCERDDPSHVKGCGEMPCPVAGSGIGTASGSPSLLCGGGCWGRNSCGGEGRMQSEFGPGVIGRGGSSTHGLGTCSQS